MMSKAEGGITIDDLMYMAQQAQEIGKEHKVPGDQHIMHLLASVAREAEDSFGEKGLEMVGRAVTRYGEERGRRIARIVTEAGEPLTLMNFFIYHDLEISANEMTPELVDGEFHVRVSRCGLADKLEEFGLEEYGKHYCLYLDFASLKGYNPKLQIDIKSQLTLGDDCCWFIYRQPSEAVDGEG